MQTQETQLKALVARLPEAAGGGGIGTKQDAFAKAVWRFGPPAIPLLLPYLKHPDSAVRDLTGYTLAGVSGLNASHLDALIDANRAGVGWLEVPIARIGTPRAIDYLIDKLQRDRGGSQVDFAFGVLGANGVPALCSLLRTARISTDIWQDSLAGAIRDAFVFQDAKAKQCAVPLLIDIAMSNWLPVPNRQCAVAILGDTEEAGRQCVPVLLRLARREPADFQDMVNKTLVGLKVPQAVPYLLRRIGQKDGYSSLAMEDIALLEKNGVSAGPELVRYFRDPDWDTRVDAACTAGFVGYRAAIPDLISLLASEEDWRLVWVAAESLGRLQAGDAVNALQRVMENHWYPPVREAARTALAHIRSHQPYRLDPRQGMIGAFLAHEYAALNTTPPPPPPTRASYKISVSGGTLVGTNNGEWGGALTFVASDGAKHILIQDNTESVATLAGRLIAATGLAHLFNNGSLWQVTQDNSGNWSATRWRRLPGAPSWAEVRQGKGGPLLRVACWGGLVDVAPSGEMHLLG